MTVDTTSGQVYEVDTGSYRFVIEKRPGYLYGCIEAKIMSVEIMIEYVNELARQLRSCGHNRILTSRKTPIMLPLKTYSFIGDVAKSIFPPDLRIALVDSMPENENIKDQAAGEVKKAGLNVRLFNNEQDAEKWLLQDA